MASNPAPAASSEAQIDTYLASLGLDPVARAGFLGNFQVESGWNPGAYNPGEGAIGIAQWENGRRTALQSLAQRTGGNERSLATQLAYLAQELRGPFASVLAHLRGVSDPGQAAAIVDAEFEISSGSARSDRMSNARNIYAQIAAGQPLTGGASLPDQVGSINGVPSSIPTADGIAALGPKKGGSILSSWQELLPWNVFGRVVSSGWSDVTQAILSFTLKLAFITGGLALVVAGFWRASAGPRAQAQQAASEAATVAAVAA